VLPHSCEGTLQNLHLKLLYSSTQTSADGLNGQRQVSRMIDEKSETFQYTEMYNKPEVRCRIASKLTPSVAARCPPLSLCLVITSAPYIYTHRLQPSGLQAPAVNYCVSATAPPAGRLWHYCKWTVARHQKHMSPSDDINRAPACVAALWPTECVSEIDRWRSGQSTNCRTCAVWSHALLLSY